MQDNERKIKSASEQQTTDRSVLQEREQENERLRKENEQLKTEREKLREGQKRLSQDQDELNRQAQLREQKQQSIIHSMQRKAELDYSGPQVYSREMGPQKLSATRAAIIIAADELPKPRDQRQFDPNLDPALALWLGKNRDISVLYRRDNRESVSVRQNETDSTDRLDTKPRRTEVPETAVPRRAYRDCLETVSRWSRDKSVFREV
jgi:hypothetical protein